MKIALRKKLIKKHITRNLYQMPNMSELVNNAALASRGNATDPIWFSHVGLNYAYSQIASSEATN